ncbi:MAG: hypothetical protein HKN23_04170 [Verrucomicrobiales bacterium]|nr:hypothetical protein [Verrucomicrobiales bacterium]
MPQPNRIRTRKAIVATIQQGTFVKPTLLVRFTAFDLAENSAYDFGMMKR